MKFKFLTGDVNWSDYWGKWLAGPFNNGEFDYYFVLSLTNLLDACGEREAKEAGGKYLVDMSVVAPEEFQDKQSALDYCGCTFMWPQLKAYEKVEMISSYGGSAIVFSGIGNNYKKLFKAAKDKAKEAEMLFGFFMDRLLNKIGSTGWD